jgi:hypothetical protein
MTDEPLMNDDDIYIDDYLPVIHQPIETRKGRITFDPNAVYVDKALLVKLVRKVLAEMQTDGYTSDEINDLRLQCLQILREHGDG